MIVFWVCFFMVCAVGLSSNLSHTMPGMKRREEQCVVLKFLCASGKRPIECHRELVSVFGNDVMSKAQVGVWHHRFRGGDIDVKDKKRSGRPASVNTEAQRHVLRTALDQDRCASIWSLSSQTGINCGTVHKIIKKSFTMKKVAPKFVPRMLTDEMKRSRVTMCQQNLDLFQEDPALLSKVVTGDESYFSVFDVETKLSSMQWKTPEEPCPSKALRSRSEHKTMLTCFFDEQGSILNEFRKPGDPVTADTYCTLLKVLKERIRKKHPMLWARSDPDDPTSDHMFFLHHDNASPHTAVPTLALIGESNIRMLAHPPIAWI